MCAVQYFPWHKLVHVTSDYSCISWDAGHLESEMSQQAPSLTRALKTIKLSMEL